MRSRIPQCDLAIIPYNYLIDKSLRDQVELKLEDAVVIFDEGHNIETFCEDLYTFELSVHELFQIQDLLRQVTLGLLAQESQACSEYERFQCKGRRLDAQALRIFVLKTIDVLEAYNLDRPDNRLEIESMPENMHIYRLPELFSLLAMVFGKLKDEKDFMLDRMRQQAEGELSFLGKLDAFLHILEACVLDSGPNAKLLNRFQDALAKVRVAYEHYEA